MNKMQKLMQDTPEPLRSPTDLRLKRADLIAEAVWWVMFIVCLGVLIYGVIA